MPQLLPRVTAQVLSLSALSLGCLTATGQTANPEFSAPTASTAAPNPADLPRELGKPEDDLSVDVQRYQVNGLSHPTAELTARLNAATAPYTGSQRSFEDLVNAAAAVTRVLQRDLGYYVGFAYLPEQSGAAPGVVQLQVLEGRLDEVILRWPEGGESALPVRREVVERHLAELRPGAILEGRQVERVAFLLNDLRGISTRFEITPGRSAGTASLIVTPQAEARVRTRVELDTLGSRYTGVGRLSGVTSIASPTGRGDTLTIHALASTTGGLGYGGINYLTPVGYQGLKLGATLSKVRYRLDQDDFPERLTGEAVASTAFALYPVVRSRNLNVFAQASYENKRFEDRQPGLERRKSSDDWLLGLVGDSRDRVFGGAINTFEIAWLQGRMHYDGGLVPPGLKRNFGKANLSVSRLQNLVSNRLQLYARYKAQLANTSLDATERFALGGPSAVRAFGPGEAAADTGHLVTAELRLLPPEAWLGRWSRELMFSAFYDWGHAKFSHDPALQDTGVDNTAALSAYGLGMVWERPGDLAFRLHLAWRGTGDALADTRDHQPRANAVLSKSF